MKWIKLDSVPSTNSYLSEIIKEGKGLTDMVVTADYQEYGKGQGGHTWQSQPGENLLMSLLLHPAFLSASDQFQLSVLTSLALCELLEQFGVRPLIKWPNDILAGRGKIAGILMEHGIIGKKISHSIVGIGLNLNQTTFADFPMGATSLKLETGSAVDPANMAEMLVARILNNFRQLEEDGGDALEQAYLEKMYRIHQHSLFRAGGREFTGVILGINRYGELCVDQEGEVQTYGHQEIAYVE